MPLNNDDTDDEDLLTQEQEDDKDDSSDESSLPGDLGISPAGAVAVPEKGVPPPGSTVAATSPEDRDTLRKKLYENLTNQVQGAKNGQVPESRNIADRAAQQASTNALLASLNKSAAMMGSIGGKIAETSGPSEMAQSTSQLGMQRAQLAEKENEKKNLLQQHLLGLLETQQRAEDQRKFAQNESDLNRKNRVDVANTRADAMKSLAESRGSASKDTKLMAQQQKMDDTLEKDRQALTKQLTGTTRNEIGSNRIKINAAEKLETLLAAHPDGNIPPQFMTELAMGMANLVSPGGVTESEIRALDPQSLQRTVASYAQALTGQPVGANMPEFVGLMKETLSREKGAASDQLRRAVVREASGYQRLQKQDPEFIKQMYAQEGITPEMLKQSGTQGFAQYTPQVLGKSAVPGKEGESGTAFAGPKGVLSPQDQQAYQWAKDNAQDPRAAKIMQRLQPMMGGP